MKDLNPFICKYPFTFVSKDSSAGHCKPCCRYILDKEDYEDSDLKANVETAFRSKTFEKIRNKMLKREKLTGCQKCYDEEENGQKSYGRISTEQDLNFSPGILKGINIAFSRECNLACRMCNPDFSTKWDSVWSRLYPNEKSGLNAHFEYKDIISSEETLKNVELWNIVGGEPFINDSFYKFLEHLRHYDLSNKIIDISTNGTFFPKQKYIDILLQFKRFSLGFSVDGINQLGEYIRMYSKWLKTEQVIDKWRELQVKNPSLYLYSSTTVSAYNVHDLYSIFRWSLKKNIDFRFHVLYRPEYLQIRVLPENLRHKIYKHYLQFPDFQKHLLKLKKHFFQKSSWKLEEFLIFTEKLDKILGKNFFQLNDFYTKQDLIF